MLASPIILRSQPGVRRDGTRFDADYYNDVLWCRFQRGLPRKMRGFRSMTSSMLGIPRGMWLTARGGSNYLHVGCNNYLQQVPFDNDGNASPPFDRTPAGFAASDSNLWTFDTLYDPVAGTVTWALGACGRLTPYFTALLTSSVATTPAA